MSSISNNCIAVIDFETTGLSPAMGDRATEVAIVLVDQASGKVVDSFQSLMNAGRYIPSFIESLTGISNAMVAAAPAADTVMREASRFVGSAPMVAHNASFDRRFWEAELSLAGEKNQTSQPFVCTMLVARRLYPQAPSHKLGVLIDYHRLPKAGRAHRAMADAEMAASLLGQIQDDLRSRHRVAKPDHGLLLALQRCARPGVGALMSKYAD
jgi:DNA polymerase-3 subunit epsilon